MRAVRWNCRSEVAGTVTEEPEGTSAFRRWAMPFFAVLGVALGLWVWASIVPVAAGAEVRASGETFTVVRDDGAPWRVTSFQPGRTAEVAVAVRRRGPLPVRIVDVPDVTAGPPRDTYCGWWPDRVLIDGEDLTARDAPLPVARTALTELVVSGRFLGGPGCLDEGRIGGRRAVFVDVSILGAPKRVRVELPMRMTWSTDPAASVQRLAERPVAPRVGTAP